MILSDEQHLFVHDREILAKDLANKSEEECYRILCGYKRGKEKYKKPSLDHIVPKSKGATNDIENLQFCRGLRIGVKTICPKKIGII